jgi:monofunctional biosynthetic peptidoglycan transglycosylase
MSRISPSLQRAVVAAEDARFWSHDGVDWQAIRTAARRDWDRGKISHGGSTITQQLAKNLYLSPARTPWRKLREWAIARRLEKELPKRRILELYLNVVEFGPRTFGAEAAARRYFDKPASALAPSEAATLAAMIPSPRIYDPIRHPGRVERRARRIRRLM